VAFTSGRFHEPIRITPRNHGVTEAACRHCHAAVVDAIDAGRHGPARLTCTGCHASVGHLQ
jgi:cytochrome c nitrite reductase small subunit